MMLHSLSLAIPDCLSFSSSANLSSLSVKSLHHASSQTAVFDFGTCRRGGIKATLITTPDAFEVGRLVGTYGFMNVTSYKGLQPGGGLDYANSADEEDIGRFKMQDVGQGSVSIRLYEGRIAQGPYRGTPVIFKVYPGNRAGGTEADMMAANELNAHSFLQGNSIDHFQNIQILLGGFETSTGEQWLAFRDYGKFSAADYSKAASEKISKSRGENSWNQYDAQQKVKRKRLFVMRILYGAINGLAFMHERERLHQSLGPASVVLNTMAEREAAYLIPRLRDLAFSVDISYSSITNNHDMLSEALWRRAINAGAYTPLEKRAFGIADDIYEAGLLFAYLAFVPFSEAGIMDGLSLQRLLENTFQLDFEAMREYCVADDQLADVVSFLDLGDGAGWELLQAMMNPNFRERPTARAVLSHRFLTGVVL